MKRLREKQRTMRLFPKNLKRTEELEETEEVEEDAALTEERRPSKIATSGDEVSTSIKLLAPPSLCNMRTINKFNQEKWIRTRIDKNQRTSKTEHKTKHYSYKKCAWRYKKNNGHMLSTGDDQTRNIISKTRNNNPCEKCIEAQCKEDEISSHETSETRKKNVQAARWYVLACKNMCRCKDNQELRSSTK